MQIFVKALVGGVTLPLSDVELHDTIGDIKLKIQDKTGTLTAQQHLYYREDHELINTKSLEDCAIEANSIVCLSAGKLFLYEKFNECVAVILSATDTFEDVVHKIHGNTIHLLAVRKNAMISVNRESKLNELIQGITLVLHDNFGISNTFYVSPKDTYQTIFKQIYEKIPIKLRCAKSSAQIIINVNDTVSEAISRAEPQNLSMESNGMDTTSANTRYDTSNNNDNNSNNNNGKKTTKTNKNRKKAESNLYKFVLQKNLK